LERDAGKRSDLYLKIEREHQQVSPFVIMFQETEVTAMRKNVNGFVIGPSFDDNKYNGVTKN
jgi:peptide/nickel transport system substrate-binding protein